MAELGARRKSGPNRVAVLRHQLPGKARPGGIDLIRVRMMAALGGKEGALWAWCRDKAIILHYGLAQRRDRVRDWRGDNALNVAAVLDVLLSYAQVMSGFVGRPRPGGGRYERLNERDFAQLAFGEQDDSAVRLVRDCMAQIVAMGLMKPTKQVRRRREDIREFRSAAGVRILNLEQLARLTGCWHILSAARRKIERQRGDRPAAAANDDAPAVVVARELDAAGSIDGDRDRPPSTGDPPRQRSPDEVIARFREMKELAAGD